MNRKYATLYFSIVAVLLGFQTAFAQNIGYLGRTHSLTIKGIAPFSVSSCNLEITLPDGEKVEKEVNAPDFETKVDFVPKSVGRNLIEWEGKLKLRGFNPILGCTGGGKIFVEVTYPKQAQLDEKDIELLANARQLARDKKISEAFPIFKQLAEKGHAQSQAFVAVAYYRGEGATRNFAEAFKWATLAAETEANSMNLLGIMYLNGHGVKQDCDLAVKYYRSAIEKNNVNAMVNLGRAYLSGGCVTSDPAEAKPLLDRAASLGNASAMFSLGGMYEKGQGVERDEKVAIDWYRKASDGGVEQAKKELARMEAAEASALKDKQRIQAEQLAKKEEEERNARWLSSPEYKKQQLEIAKQEQAERERTERQRLADERKAAEEEKRSAKVAQTRQAEQANLIKQRQEAEVKRQADNAKEFPYEAILTCGFGGDHINIMACFVGSNSSAKTQLEIRNGQQYGMYQGWELNKVGSETQAGFVILLRKNFSIVAQNSNDTLILNLVVRNTLTNNVLYTKSASKYGVISVKN